jgi:hypothetical protein
MRFLQDQPMPGSLVAVRPISAPAGSYPCTETFHDGPYGPRSPDRMLVALLAMWPELVIRDGLDPRHVHAAFLDVDEYRAMMPPDMPHPSSV